MQNYAPGTAPLPPAAAQHGAAELKDKSNGGRENCK